MVTIARPKREGVKDFFISNKVYAFDSSTIYLCLSVFWWTKLHHGKGGVKLHELYDVKTEIPAFSIVTDASLHDSKVMDQIPYEKDSFYIFDSAYMVICCILYTERGFLCGQGKTQDGLQGSERQII